MFCCPGPDKAPCAMHTHTPPPLPLRGLFGSNYPRQLPKQTSQDFSTKAGGQRLIPMQLGVLGLRLSKQMLSGWL